MSLKLKIFLVLFVVLIFYGAASFTIQRAIIMPDFIELERSYLVKDLERSFGAISARPVIKSNVLGPSRGTLIMGRFLNEPVLDRIRSRSVEEMTVLTERNLLSYFRGTGFGELQCGEPYTFYGID